MAPSDNFSLLAMLKQSKVEKQFLENESISEKSNE